MSTMQVPIEKTWIYAIRLREDASALSQLEIGMRVMSRFVLALATVFAGVTGASAQTAHP